MSSKQAFKGLTDRQVLSILDQIASKANLMAQMCRVEALRSGEHDTALVFYALDTMLSCVGALADLPTGGDVLGDFPAWLVGPNFNQASGGEACAS